MRYIELVGPCHISIVEFNAETGTEFRRSILPGRYADGVWVDTDISAEADDVKALALSAWTTEAVDAFKIATAPGDIEPAIPRPEIYAVANLGITPGEITGIETAAKFSAAMYLDVGLYLLFFTETQPDTSYLAKAYDDATRVRVTEKGTDYITVTATDGNDDPIDPTEISVEIIRVS